MMKKIIFGALFASTMFASAASADIVRVETAYNPTSDIHRFYFIDETGSETYHDGVAGSGFGASLEHVITVVGSANAAAVARQIWEEGDENDAAADAARALQPTDVAALYGNAVIPANNDGFNGNLRSIIEERIRTVSGNTAGVTHWADATIILLNDQAAGITLWETLDTAFDNVWTDGYNEGFNDGYDRGFADGFDAGVAHGINLVSN